MRQLEVRISTSNPLKRPEFPQLWNYLGEFDHDLTVTEPWKDGFYTEIVPIYRLNSGKWNIIIYPVTLDLFFAVLVWKHFKVSNANGQVELESPLIELTMILQIFRRGWHNHFVRMVQENNILRFREIVVPPRHVFW